jgi:uncharacterized lipoprotein YehR (DUF1307 family)
MKNKILSIFLGTLLVLSVSGCGDTMNSLQVHNKNAVQHSLTRPFSDMLYGFSKMEKFVANGDYADAKTLSRNLSDEFHETILPPLVVKKGKKYADRIHLKYDELEQAMDSKNKSKITRLIKENQENFKTIAPMLGVSVF